MADNVPITAGTGTNIAADDVSSVFYQRVKLDGGGDGAAAPILGDSTNGLDVDVTRLPALVAGSANIGDVDVLTVPADPFGANADAASATGSISAKLRFVAATGIPVTALPSLPAGSANIGDVDVLTVPEVAGAAASTINSTSSDGGTALTNAAQVIKASAGKLVGYYIYNPNTVVVYVQVYNTAAAGVTVGTTNPLFMLTIPALSAANLWMQPGGITFGTAMSWAAVMTTAGGNTAPTTALDAVAFFV